MITRRIRLTCIRIVLLGVLFAQAAVAASVCLTPSSMRAQPVASAAASHCEQSDEISLNLCLYQWADQTDQSATLAVIAVPLAAVLTVPDAAPCLLSRITPLVSGSAGHGPPIPIRFCSFLI